MKWLSAYCKWDCTWDQMTEVPPTFCIEQNYVCVLHIAWRQHPFPFDWAALPHSGGSHLSSSQNLQEYFSWKSLRNLTAWKVISSRLLLLKGFINFFINEPDSSCIFFSSASLNQPICKYLEDSKKQQQAYMSQDEVVKPTALQQAFYPALWWFRKKQVLSMYYSKCLPLGNILTERGGYRGGSGSH